jgi:hypothetical protein
VEGVGVYLAASSTPDPLADLWLIVIDPQNDPFVNTPPAETIFESEDPVGSGVAGGGQMRSMEEYIFCIYNTYLYKGLYVYIYMPKYR